MIKICQKRDKTQSYLQNHMRLPFKHDSYLTPPKKERKAKNEKYANL